MTGKARVHDEKSDVENRNMADKQTKRPYARPEVLSSERLEAAAATCSPPAPPYGKTVPTPCSTLGS